MKMSIDKNGNKILQVQAKDFNKGRGFSIQSNGNLPIAHRRFAIGEKIPANDPYHDVIAGEVRIYVCEYGTDAQKKKVL